MSGREQAPALETRDLAVAYGATLAIRDITLTVEKGTVVGIIGPNGAGKTTLLDAISGFIPLRSGQIFLAGEDVTGAGARDRARRGIGRTFQGVELFHDLSVFDNVLVAAEEYRWWTPFRDLAGSASSRVARERAQAALVSLGLDSVADEFPADISHGHQKLVGVARAIAAEPDLMLLDEPAAGLDVDESKEFGTTIRKLRASGQSLLLIDHDMGLILDVCDMIYVLNFGKLIAHGTTAEIRRNEDVIAAYLGDDTAEPAAASGQGGPIGG